MRPPKESPITAAAREYLARGVAVVPISLGTKACELKNWYSLNIREKDVPKYFSNGAGIGICLGEASNGLIDVDIDSPEALALADAFLPQSAMIHGRASKPRSHRWYVCSAIKKVTRFEDGDVVLIELRGGSFADGGSAQTVAPPSRHKDTGEIIEWVSSGQPAEVGADDLIRAVQTVAAGAILARHWPAQGSRHLASLALAGMLLRAGWDPQRAENFLVAVARAARDEEARSRDADVHTTAQKIVDKQPVTGAPELAKLLDKKTVKQAREWLSITDSARSFACVGSSHDDVSNAERFAAMHSENVRYWHGRNKWVLWTGTHWDDDQLAAVTELAKETAKSIYAEAAKLPSDDAAKRGRWAERSMQQDKIRAMLDMAKSLPGIAVNTDEFDSDPWALNFLNGTVDLRTGDLREHDPADYITKIVRYVYDPTDSRFEKSLSWGKFLADTFSSDSDLIAWIQKAVGYSLTGDTREKCVFIPWGPTDTGKTTFLETLRSIFKEYSALIQIDTLMWNKGVADNNTAADLADLRGARFVTTSETEEGQRLREAKLKRITQGMGEIKTARKYENPISFKETHKLWMDCNHQPMLYGTDDAIWNRLLPIPFKHKLAENAKDRELKNKLEQRAEAIIVWAVAGAVRWYKEGLGRPAVIEQERKIWRERVDIIGEFIAECCVKSEEDSIGASELYAAFKRYVGKQGHHAITSTAFGLRMMERGFEKKPYGASRRIAYLGIRLLELGEDASKIPKIPSRGRQQCLSLGDDGEVRL